MEQAAAAPTPIVSTGLLEQILALDQLTLRQHTRSASGTAASWPATGRPAKADFTLQLA